MIRLTDLDQYLAAPDTPIREVMARLNATPHLFQMVVDASGQLRGTVTDGDIRRALLRGATLGDPVAACMHTDFVFSRADDGDENDRLLTSGQRPVTFLPILDKHDRIVELLVGAGIDPAISVAIVMAGGFGRRLGAHTRKTPKPLLSVGGRPILDHLLQSLEDNGVRDIHVSVHYLADQIKSFVRDRDNQARIHFVEEETPLGTAGALGQIGEIGQSPILVVNGDIVTQVDFAAMHDFHDRHGYDGTIAVIRHDTDIPFGVVRYGEDGSFERIDEKPVLSHFVAAGVYLLSPVFAGLVARDEAMDMNELLNLGRQVGLSIGLFPIHEYWVDVGHPEDLDRAMRDHNR